MNPHDFEERNFLMLMLEDNYLVFGAKQIHVLHKVFGVIKQHSVCSIWYENHTHSEHLSVCYNHDNVYDSG